jgi:hypothetical protein
MIDINTIEQLLITGAWIVPVITALVGVIRATFWRIDERYLPAISLLVGVFLGILLIGFTIVGAFAGMIFGLTASGFYDLGKKTIAGN